ncbi:MAG: (2Fe-2S) ferredoxin domain-containing protein [Candidatus Aminicenantales bacterium]
MPKLSIEDLKKIREKAKTTAILREGGPYRIKVTVHMGTCGIAAGARDIMAALMKEAEERRIQDVLLTSSGCAGMCSNEPMATVEFAGKTPIKYICLTPEKTREIFEKHILGGEPVLAYALAAGSERAI